jgi:hypothetical protein
VVDASCYQHCVECCNGSCGARANMDCQTTCQDQEFETCGQRDPTMRRGVDSARHRRTGVRGGRGR